MMELKEPISEVYEPDVAIVVPPFIKYSAGPLLGPSLLAGTAKAHGYSAHILDLNIDYIHSKTNFADFESEPLLFLGDHSKPSVLDSVQLIFWKEVLAGFPKFNDCDIEYVRNGWYSHWEADKATQRLSDSHIAKLFIESLQNIKPRLFGVSVMWAGQVIPALLISKIIKTNYSNTKIVWGGPHVTAIIREIANDTGYGKWVDGFLPNHCEGSFLELLSAVKIGDFRCRGLVVPGFGKPSVLPETLHSLPLPAFSNLAKYGRPTLMLPFEISVGCAYSRCAFCTYPAIEGAYRMLSATKLDQFVDLAASKNAGISFKDSLLPVPVLRGIASIVNGRVPWSGCTKLSSSLDTRLMRFLASNGCKTLEIGLESLLSETQQIIDKVQSRELLVNFLKSASTAGISVVINYITDFPWEDQKESLSALNALKSIARDVSRLSYHIEQNHFGLERLSPMGLNPGKYGVTVTGSWPWSSLLRWKREKGDRTNPVTDQVQFKGRGLGGSALTEVALTDSILNTGDSNVFSGRGKEDVI